MAPGNSGNAFPKQQKMADESLVTRYHVLPSRMGSCPCIVRGLRELQQGTGGDWQLSTIPSGAKACGPPEAKRSRPPRSADTLIGSRRCQIGTHSLSSYWRAGWGRSKQGSKKMLAWWQHFVPGGWNSEVIQGCYTSCLHSPTYFLVSSTIFWRLGALKPTNQHTSWRSTLYSFKSHLFSLERAGSQATTSQPGHNSILGIISKPEG